VTRARGASVTTLFTNSSEDAPARSSWVGYTPALELIEAVGVDAIHANDVGLANRFLGGLGLPPGDSAIVSLELHDDAADRLAAAGVMVAGRSGKVRFSFHLSTRRGRREQRAGRAVQELTSGRTEGHERTYEG
jgi:hypothetical protein